MTILRNALAKRNFKVYMFLEQLGTIVMQSVYVKANLMNLEKCTAISIPNAERLVVVNDYFFKSVEC